MSWRSTNAPPASSRTDDIWCLDPKVGWTVNSNGSIIHTTDGFDSFEVQFQDVPPIGFDPIWLSRLCLIQQEAGARALTAGKTLFEATDGKSWTQVTNLPTLAPSAIYALCGQPAKWFYASGTVFRTARPA